MARRQANAHFPCLLLALLNLYCEATNLSVNSLFILGDPIGCPTENFMGLEEVQNGTREWQSHSQNYGIGDETSFRCKFDEDPHHPDLFMVFPSEKRTCQPDGTWSNVPPACVMKLKHFQNNADILGALPREIQQCAADDCSEERDNWRPVGRLDSTCSPSLGELDDESHQDSNATKVTELLLTFPRHLHFNIMTFSLPNNTGASRGYLMEVKAPLQGAIQDLSQEASDFLENHHKELQASADLNASNECAVIRMDVYTRQLLIRFSVETTPENNLGNGEFLPFLRFYPVPQVDRSSERVSNSLDGSGCSEPPTIPKTVQTHLGHSVYQYDCPSGILVNPITNELAGNRIRCHRNHEWGPYPFPVCRPIIKPLIDNDPVESDQTSHVPTKHVQFFSPIVEEPLRNAIDDLFPHVEEEKVSSLSKPRRKPKKKPMPETVNPTSSSDHSSTLNVAVDDAISSEHKTKNVLHGDPLITYSKEGWEKELPSYIGLKFLLSLGLGMLVVVYLLFWLFFLISNARELKYRKLEPSRSVA